MTNEQLWQAILGELELTLSKANFTTWFRGTFISDYDERGEVMIGVPNVFTKSWLEKKYSKPIIKAFENITSNKVRRLVYKIENCKKATEKKETEKEIVRERDNEKYQTKALSYQTGPLLQHEEYFNLNDRYKFESFVVGVGNELAHAASIAVSKNPGIKYNPLFLYGGVGLGKTHLMQAIGNNVCKENPASKVMYVNFEKFTNDYVRAAKTGGFDSFRQLYRGVDVLLVDDVQFMLNKEKTQDEFFHTFEALHQRNKQIVITSDRPPKSLSELQDRLVSRFEWGMIADIAMPDFETRMAILKNKCEEKGINLKDSILEYIAVNVKHNIRELEGALNKIIAWDQLNHTAIGMEEVKQILSSVLANLSQGALTSKKVIQEVASYYDLEESSLVGASRKRELVLPRQVIMYIMRIELGSSYPLIGQDLGGRDHTTAMHAFKKIERKIADDDRLRQQIDSIKQRLYL